MNLELTDVSVRYGKTEVLHGVSHTFREGKVTCIIGPNGCGKTTLIKALVRKYAKSGSLSYIPQTVYGNVALTVKDTVALGRYDKSRFIYGETQEDLKLVSKALELMELTDKADRIFDTLSGGEMQRCMAARAICQDAKWLIMDEPASNLDVVHSKLIMDTGRKMVREDGKSMIIVMHDINAAVTYGDEFVLMKDGRIIKVTDSLDSKVLSEVFDTDFFEVKTPSGKNVFYID